MAEAITVPRLGWSMEEGTFAGWLKEDGHPIKPGDTLYILESEKGAEEIEALDSGILRILPDGPKSGDLVKVGQVLAYLAGEGEEIQAEEKSRRGEEETGRKGDEETGRKGEEETGLAYGSRNASSPVSSSPILPLSSSPLLPVCPASSPRARRIAAELGIDWKGLGGSGRNGRVRERDVRAAASGGGEGRLIPHTKIRRLIAARMVAGVTQAAPVTLVTKVDATNLVALRSKFKAATTPPDDIVPSYTDLMLKLTASALGQHPLLQAQWRDDGLFVPNRIDIAVSVDTEAGLFAPVLREVDKLTVMQLADRSSELIAQARAGQLTPDQMRGATFTVTNLGGLGIDAFTPIITLPQCAVLGIGRIVRELAVVNNEIIPRDMMTLSLTFDHRILDGAPAAKFLQTLRGFLENPASWLS